MDVRTKKMALRIWPNAHANGADPATEVECVCGAQWTFSGGHGPGFCCPTPTPIDENGSVRCASCKQSEGVSNAAHMDVWDAWLTEHAAHEDARALKTREQLKST